MKVCDRYRNLAIVCVSATVALTLAVSCSKSPTASKNPPNITQFAAAPTDIAPGDSTQISYTVTGADSVVLTPPRQKLADAQSGSLWVKPLVPTQYVLYAYNGDGRDSSVAAVTMSSAMPLFVSAAPSPDTIVLHDSALFSWNVLRADSILVNQGIGKLPGNTSGNLWLRPTATTSYRAIAFNRYGADTATFSLIVQVPYQIRTQYGQYYKGTMGFNSLDPQLKFSVITTSSEVATKAWMHFRVIDGDGTLSLGVNDSVRVDQSGWATLLYNFSGVLGHAIVRGVVTGVDSTDVYLRASILTPGANGQGQYVLFSDRYAAVKALNGNPVSLDPDPTNTCVYYADYESPLGVVVIMGDIGCNGVYSDSDLVLGVIVNTVYTGKTKEGIGIYSTLGEVRSAYGTPDSLYADPSPDTVVVKYLSRGLTFYCGTSGDSLVAEIHLVDVGSGASNLLNTSSPARKTASLDMLGYRRP